MSTNHFSVIPLRKIKQRTANLLLAFVGRLRLPIHSNRLLIVRLDAIGDYILFRNHLRALLEDDRWKKYKVTLVGNIVFQDIAESFDSDVISEFKWIYPAALVDHRNLLSLILHLKKRRFDFAINPVHSRSFLQDQLMHYSGSKFLIGSSGDSTVYNSDDEKKRGDAIYDQLVPVPSYSVFEYFRNQGLVAALSSKPREPMLSMPSKKSPHVDNDRINVVLVGGAGAPFRRWPATSFSELVTAIYSANPTVQFMLAGSPTEADISNEIKSMAGVSIKDLTGKTSLVELVDLIASSDLLISNETSAVHIAASVGTNAICISNGNHFGRFNPYPQSLSTKVITIYPLDKFYTTDKKQVTELVEHYRIQSNEDIRKVTVSGLIKEVQENIKKSKKSGNEVPPGFMIFERMATTNN